MTAVAPGEGIPTASPTSLTPEIKALAQQRMMGAILRAGFLMPYTKTFITALNPTMTERLPTLAVTPDLVLLYNPFFAAGLSTSGKMSIWELATGFLHESLHVIFKHFDREKVFVREVLEPRHERLDFSAVNLCEDAEINSLLVNLVPINPVLENLAAGVLSDLRASRPGTSKDRLFAEARRKAEAQWAGLPPERKYPVPDWPKDPVNLPKWFVFPNSPAVFDPIQPFGREWEAYYPFVRRSCVHPPGPPPPPPPPWAGFKIGDRVAIKATGEEGVVTAAGPWDPATKTQPGVVVTVTNAVKEPSRTVEDAKIIGTLTKAAAGSPAVEDPTGEFVLGGPR